MTFSDLLPVIIALIGVTLGSLVGTGVIKIGKQDDYHYVGLNKYLNKALSKPIKKQQYITPAHFGTGFVNNIQEHQLNASVCGGRMYPITKNLDPEYGWEKIDPNCPCTQFIKSP